MKREQRLEFIEKVSRDCKTIEDIERSLLTLELQHTRRTIREDTKFLFQLSRIDSSKVKDSELFAFRRL